MLIYYYYTQHDNLLQIVRDGDRGVPLERIVEERLENILVHQASALHLTNLSHRHLGLGVVEREVKALVVQVPPIRDNMCL